MHLLGINTTQRHREILDWTGFNHFRICRVAKKIVID